MPNKYVLKSDMKKFFTLYEANRALIFVSPVVKDIANTLLTLETANEKNITIVLNKIQNYIDELKLVGAILIDPKKGLVGFPSFYKNEPVILSYQIEENEILYYHKIYDDPMNRIRITKDFIENNSTSPTEFATA